MKIKPEHYAELKSKIASFVDANREAVLAHRKSLKSDGRVRDLDMRFRWDVSHAAGVTPWACEALYPYMNDDHIDTALRHVVAELNLPRDTDAVTAAVASLTPALVAEYHAETDKMVWVLETFFPGLGIDRAESMILAVEDAIVAFPG